MENVESFLSLDAYLHHRVVRHELLNHPDHELHPLLELEEALLDGQQPLEAGGLRVLLNLLQQHFQRRPLDS